MATFALRKVRLLQGTKSYKKGDALPSAKKKKKKKKEKKKEKKINKKKTGRDDSHRVYKFS